MGRDRHVHDAAALVCQDNQHEEESIRGGWRDEEIGSHDLADMIREKRAPGLRGRLTPPHDVLRDGRLTDVDPEFQQFAMNPRRAPPRVLLRHRPNQRADVGLHGRPQGGADFSRSTTAGSPVGAKR